MVIRPQFEQVEPFSSGGAVVWNARVKKSGLIDRAGNLILPHEFTSIEPFHEGLAAVRGPKGPGYITPEGRPAIKAAGWDFCTSSEGFGVFSEGLAAVQVGHRWGYIDTTGTMIIEPRFLNTSSFVDGLALADTGTFWSYINTHGSPGMPFGFPLAWAFRCRNPQPVCGTAL